MIFLFGDLHGCENLYQFDEINFPDGYELTKEDYVIILGDFGIPWSSELYYPEEYYYEMSKVKWLSERPWTTLFIDGNHENFDNLAMLPEKDMLGGKVGVLADSVYHLLRGHIYTIENRTFFCFGGALSIDKARRITGVSWWKQEEPSNKEISFALNNLEKHGNKVDYILTHTASNRVFDKMFKGNPDFYKIKDSTSDFLDIVEAMTEYDKWFFGHFHVDWMSDPLETPVYYTFMNTYARLNTNENICSIAKVKRETSSHWHY